jgi:2-haloacid dehalogenase|tara:strand:+ start:166 stop:879 length:714 start_codon:yes stop_codon:yes gene_type:complete
VSHNEVKALVFDVFGTVVDWRTSIIDECLILGQKKHIDIDWTKFVDDWRAGYRPAMDTIRNDEAKWRVLDELHMDILLDLIKSYSISLNSEEIIHLNKCWHRLHPWNDSVNGITRLNARFITATLSNGNVSLLTNMAKFAKLPWSCILSAELFKHYKPDDEVYKGAANILGLEPKEVMMVAAHKSDLLAAKSNGLVTAYINRPYEFGKYSVEVEDVEKDIDIWASDLESLADQLECN